MPAATDSYCALVGRLRDLDGAVLSEDEAQAVRDAADARLFGDDDQIEMVDHALALLDRLVKAARLSNRTCLLLSDLLSAIEPCGTRS
jgi:hypothetical protein